MSESVRAFVVRLREFVGNRRRSPRRPVRLAVAVRVLDATGRGAGAPEIGGYTRDISRSGMALVLPAIRAGSIYLTGEDTPLRLTLEMPDGSPLRCDAAPVRYHQLDAEAGGSKSYLVGVRITAITDAERARLAALRTAHSD